MGRLLLAALSLGSLAVQAIAAPRDVLIVNGTGVPLREVGARPQNAKDWVGLVPGLSPGARTRVSVDPDLCAYDVRANAADGLLTWRGVNLCETSSVTLNRRADGALWVDYD